MKKIISKTQLLIVVLILVFAGCQKQENNVDNFTTNSQNQQIENNIKSELIGSEIDILLTVTSTMKHSALFWAPENLGGSGIGYSVLQKIEKNYWNSEKEARPKPSLKKVVGEALVADGISGGIGMLGVAVTIAVAGIISGPAGWAALYVTFGESVISSGVQAFLTYYRG